MSTSINSSGVTFPNGTTQTTAATSSGTVTSVATGNGLSGGTITSTGTLVVACPASNTVGSYVCAYIFTNGAGLTYGSNYSAGGGVGVNNVQASGVGDNDSGANLNTIFVSNSLSGTWKWMGYSGGGSRQITALACRVA